MSTERHSVESCSIARRPRAERTDSAAAGKERVVGGSPGLMSRRIRSGRASGQTYSERCKTAWITCNSNINNNNSNGNNIVPAPNTTSTTTRLPPHNGGGAHRPPPTYPAPRPRSARFKGRPTEPFNHRRISRPIKSPRCVVRAVLPRSGQLQQITAAAASGPTPTATTRRGRAIPVHRRRRRNPPRIARVIIFRHFAL